MSEITRAPSLLSLSLSLSAATGSLLAAVLAGGSIALPGGALGVLLVGGGVFRGSRRLLTLGTVALLVGLLAAGAAGGAPEPLVAGMLLALVGWDVGEHGIGVGEQLGRETDTARVELVHAAATLFVGAFTAVVGYGTYRAAAGGEPVTALVFLLLGAVALVAALR